MHKFIVYSLITVSLHACIHNFSLLQKCSGQKGCYHNTVQANNGMISIAPQYISLYAWSMLHKTVVAKGYYESLYSVTNAAYTYRSLLLPDCISMLVYSAAKIFWPNSDKMSPYSSVQCFLHKVCIVSIVVVWWGSWDIGWATMVVVRCPWFWGCPSLQRGVMVCATSGLPAGTGWGHGKTGAGTLPGPEEGGTRIVYYYHYNT